MTGGNAVVAAAAAAVVVGSRLCGCGGGSSGSGAGGWGSAAKGRRLLLLLLPGGDKGAEEGRGDDVGGSERRSCPNKDEGEEEGTLLERDDDGDDGDDDEDEDEEEEEEEEDDEKGGKTQRGGFPLGTRSGGRGIGCCCCSGKGILESGHIFSTVFSSSSASSSVEAAKGGFSYALKSVSSKPQAANDTTLPSEAIRRGRKQRGAGGGRCGGFQLDETTPIRGLDRSGQSPSCFCFGEGIFQNTSFTHDCNTTSVVVAIRISVVLLIYTLHCDSNKDFKIPLRCSVATTDSSSSRPVASSMPAVSAAPPRRSW